MSAPAGPHRGTLLALVAWARTAAMVALASCSLPPLDVSAKACPCTPGWTCDTPANRCVRELATEPGKTCAVRTNHQLWCSNMATKMYAAPYPASAVVNELKTTYSWFECWATGSRHEGGNSTWYRTLGDVTAVRGYVAAFNLFTPDAFDAEPTPYGLARCPSPP